MSSAWSQTSLGSGGSASGQGSGSQTLPAVSRNPERVDPNIILSSMEFLQIFKVLLRMQG